MTDPIRVDFIRGIAMRAPGMTATRDFYAKQWGLAPLCEEGGTVYFRGTSAEHYIYAIRDDGVFGIDYVNCGMHSAARVDALYKQLVEKGARVLGEPADVTTPGGGYGFTVLDPDNRPLRILSDVERHADAAPATAMPGKVTHVVLNTPHCEATQAWYEQYLGFRVSDYSADQMVFLRCSSDHHSIALVRAPIASVNHVAFEMPGIDSFMRGIGRMKMAGNAPAWGPGRHGPGNNPFAYFVSPSGFVIEFTTEVEQIDEATHQPQVWPRNVPEKMDVWMTAGPPTPAMRAVMQGRPDPGYGA